MSADNWAKCPKCSKPEGYYEAKARNKYGKVSQEEYHHQLKTARERDRIERILFALREDYWMGIEGGVFKVSYLARCTNKDCKFEYKYSYEQSDLSEKK